MSVEPPGPSERAVPIDDRTLRVLCDLADAAGREIMAVYAGDVTAWQKADASPLTEADLRADRVIRAGLERAFPGVFILSEESRSPGDGYPRTFFLVDPLDGTKEFLKRNGEFTVNIALIDDGVPVAGVVLAPALDELFYAAAGLGAMKRSGGITAPIRVAPLPDGEPLRVIASRSHADDSVSTWLAAVCPAHSRIAIGSSLKFCRIAEGRADLYPRFGPTSQWDTAAAQAVLELAGGAVFDAHGTPLRYGLTRPILNGSFIAGADPERTAVWSRQTPSTPV